MIRSILVGALLAMGGGAWAAEIPAPGELRGAAAQAPDLTFPAEASALEANATPRMAVFKPEGPGPFPALVLFHQCGGLGQQSKRPNASMQDWARRGVEKGYVVLLIDALGPRNVDTVCMGPKNGVVFARGVRDAFQAAHHLRSLPYVDSKRVGLAGWSWGAMVGLMASRTSWAGVLGDGESFRAVVSMYPGCFTIRPRNGSAFDIAGPDVATPLLVLMGGDDTETPAKDCQPPLDAARAAGAPVEWHLYPDATHCWDCRQLNGFSKTDVRGNQVMYRYDHGTTEDSAARMFGFLDAAMR
ncbi:putative Dienelactone hydrolase(Dienelactone hydrolase,56-295) [Magnetospirillum sp. XM-1]|uniref:dienelactone hydrolase family protein n=1 Tax=Magnetospirillum sp. XM-1 TaxID=1663591 RepID=UPI00073DCA4E|nr:dienelactone hydrolase family protein [Magnetospirillum sp. XM-1]CUW38924.1 putative Dienelactone hydrolase(Dienelactone hydrolase,56-295) [Magnetospirillum sp. XM-1]